MSDSFSLAALGWKPFFQQQLSLDEWEHATPARVAAHHRASHTLVGEAGARTAPITPDTVDLTIGDWVLVDTEDRVIRRLERQSLFSRKAAGSEVREQRIAANLDTVFVVSSLDRDFNLSRLERYLVLARDAAVEPVVVLTKKDRCADPDARVAEVHSLDPRLSLVAINALDSACVATLLPWLGEGDTVACLGSSGVGKSTLVNQILGTETQGTGAVREDDDKGRHTTTARSLHLVPGGGLLIDTPGMRELQLGDVAEGVRETFRDVEALAERCRFVDCSHGDEPGCAVRAALAAGSLDERRFGSYVKLMREQALAAESLHERHRRDRQFGRLIRSVKRHTKARRGDPER